MFRPPILDSKNIEALSAREPVGFRQAIKQVIALDDGRGFDNFAG
jgi:hypothetical protein